MSENVDLARSIYADWGRAEFDCVDWAHPEIEYRGGDSVEPEIHRGIAAMELSWRAFLEDWDGFHAEAEEFRELDGHRVLVLVSRVGRGKTSGLDVGQLHAKSAHLFEIHDGVVTRLVHYWDRDRAFADLGLED